MSPGAPNNFAILSHIASAHNAAGRYVAALKFAERCVDLAPAYVYGHLHLAVTYAYLGRMEEAQREVAIASKLRPDITVASESERAVHFPEGHAIWIEGLRKAGLPES